MKDNTPDEGYPLLFVIGFITTLVSLMGVFDAREMRNIEKNGELASMRVDSVIPSRQKESPKLYLSYKGKTYTHRLGEMEKFLYTKGNKIKVRYMPGDAQVIIPSDHPGRYMMISGFFAGIGALLALFHFNSFWQKMRKTLKEPTR